MLIKEVEGHVTPVMIRDLGHRRSGMLNGKKTTFSHFAEHILLNF